MQLKKNGQKLSIDCLRENVVENFPSIASVTCVQNVLEVHPVVVRKTPRFPCRSRNLAIRRKKPSPTAENAKTVHWISDNNYVIEYEPFI